MSGLSRRVEISVSAHKLNTNHISNVKERTAAYESFQFTHKVEPRGAIAGLFAVAGGLSGARRRGPSY